MWVSKEGIKIRMRTTTIMPDRQLSFRESRAIDIARVISIFSVISAHLAYQTTNEV